MTAKIKLQVQYFRGCPHAEQAFKLVEKYHQKYDNSEAELVEVKDDRQAQDIGFRGSPTILINGQDMSGVPVPEEPHMACRFYPDGLPSFQEFEKIVHNLLFEKRK